MEKSKKVTYIIEFVSKKEEDDFEVMLEEFSKLNFIASWQRLKVVKSGGYFSNQNNQHE
jgi:hypothetical protein|tara:strand:- start:3567 stop:3743 length:177 start_codon:yes stop_codon:yes gene_type:complete